MGWNSWNKFGCNINEKFDICDFFKLKRKIKCKVCEKEINESLVNYSLKSKCFVCLDCTKNNFRKDKIYNNSLNFICNIHNKLCYNYCIDCKKNICQYCFDEFHNEHNLVDLDDINLKRKEVKKIKENYMKEKEN